VDEKIFRWPTVTINMMNQARTVTIGGNVRGPGRQAWTADLTLNKWHQMAMRIHWSANAAMGQVQLWYDGNKVVDIMAQTKADTNSMIFQTGFHRPSRSTFVDSIYLDNYVEGDSLADIMVTAFLKVAM
jgi:protein involved in polysaccharide export with SLBB domain